MNTIEVLEKLGVDPSANLDDLSDDVKIEMLKKLADYSDVNALLLIGEPGEEPGPDEEPKERSDSGE